MNYLPCGTCLSGNWIQCCTKNYIFNVMKEGGNVMNIWPEDAATCINQFRKIFSHNVSRMHIKSIATKRNHFEETKENIYCHSKCAQWKTQTQQKKKKETISLDISSFPACFLLEYFTWGFWCHDVISLCFYLVTAYKPKMNWHWITMSTELHMFVRFSMLLDWI